MRKKSRPNAMRAPAIAHPIAIPATAPPDKSPSESELCVVELLVVEPDEVPEEAVDVLEVEEFDSGPDVTETLYEGV
jgi:hypothetical protein